MKFLKLIFIIFIYSLKISVNAFNLAELYENTYWHINNILGRQNTECSICLDGLNSSQNIIVTDGDYHLYHRDCLEQCFDECLNNPEIVRLVNPVTIQIEIGLKSLKLE